MKNNFNQCFKWLLQDEGGYTNDPSDSGGATNLGITIGDYRKYIKQDATPADVKTLTVAQAEGIYKSKYWDSLGCDNLPSGVDNACFNYGVLAGVGRPRNDLKKFKDITDPTKLVDAICDEMKDFLTSISQSGSKNNKFRKGWLARTERLRSRSKSLIKSNVPGPATGVPAAVGIWAALHQYFVNHPYLITAGAIAAGGLIWWAVHTYRNRNVKPLETPVTNTQPVSGVTDPSMVG